MTTMPKTPARHLLAVLCALFLAITARAQTVDRTSFSATITSFQTYLSAYPRNVHYMAATVHFQNKTKKPLILTYNRKGITASDEQGNRYALTFVRGMGEAAGSTVDPKFVLPPEGGSDMLCELVWQQPRDVIFGITFDLNLAVREVKRLANAQLELGPETTLEFTGLKTNLAASLTGNVDLDAHRTNAGPFNAQIVRSKFGKSGRWQSVIDLTIKIQNTSDRQLILASEPNTIFGNDNEGVVYGRGSASSTALTVTGIGLSKDGQVDPQFILQPGESKEMHITIYKAERVPLGNVFNGYLCLEELEITPSKQIRVLRQYSLTFPKLDMK